MDSSTDSSSKSEALARARAWRDQRCGSPPTSAKKPKKTPAAEGCQTTTKSPRRMPAKEGLSGTTVATNTPKQEAKERALTRAREFAARRKEKEMKQTNEGNMDIDNVIDNGIPVVINFEAEHLSTVSTSVPAVQENETSPAQMEEMKRIAADMKNLSERLEAVTNKNGN